MCGRTPAAEGSALLAVLVVMALMSMAGAALTFLTTAETAISANHRIGHQVRYAAEAGIQRAMADLRGLADWSAAPGQAVSGFVDGTLRPRGPDGTPLDLTAVSQVWQAESDGRYGRASPDPDRPVWRLFAHDSLSRLAGTAELGLAYVAVWVADDAAERDGDPSRDSNGVLLLHALAFGPRGARKAIDATVLQPRPGSIAVSSWSY